MSTQRDALVDHYLPMYTMFPMFFKICDQICDQIEARLTQPLTALPPPCGSDTGL